MFSRKYRVVGLIGVLLFCAVAFFGMTSSTAFAATYATTQNNFAGSPGENRPFHPAPPPPPRRACPPVLRYGTSGNQVRQLQIVLHNQGYRGPDGRIIAINGVFDARTQFALRNFQIRHRLPVNGIAGQNEWHWLGAC